MFIAWGTRIKRLKLGYVADFCAMCHALEPFELHHVGSATHVYGISFGQGRLVGFEKTCLACRTPSATDRTVYKDVVARFDDDPSRALSALGALASATFPDVRTHYRDRLLLEELIRRDPRALDSKTRHALIREPFEILSNKTDEKLGQTIVDLPLIATFVAAVALALGMVPLFEHWFSTYRDQVPWAILAASVLGIVAVVAQARGAMRRYLRRAVYPQLAGALGRLRPEHGELETALAELRRLGVMLARRTRVGDIERALAASRPAVR